MKLKITTLIFLISGTICAQNTMTKQFDGLKSIDMSTGSGDCMIKRSADNTVTLELTHDYGNDYKPQIEQKGDRLVIKESDRGMNRGWSSTRSPKWTLTVPDDMKIDFNTGSGDFMANDIKLNLDLNAGSGDIELVNMKGEFLSNTGSGDVDIRGFEGYVKSNTGSGDVEVKDAKGDLNFNCGSGEISLNSAEGSISANVGSGEIEAEGIMVTGSSSFNSGSGDVEVSLIKSPTANLSVNSGSGDAELDFNGAEMVGELIMKAEKRHGEIEADIDFDTMDEVREGNNTVIKKVKKFDNSGIQIQVSTGSGTAELSR